MTIMNKLKIYLDNCCFNRPYDDQNYLFINIETQAKLAIQELINDGSIHLIWSFILDYENSANPDKIVQHEIFLWRSKAALIVYNNDAIVNRALNLNRSGFGKKDALHIASAIEGKANYFITVDKGILNRKNHAGELSILNPIDFIRFLEEV